MRTNSHSTALQRCLKVILKRETDLLAMAPTGSGKTAVALLAILQAFQRGQRAIYTSPIKALSNQKFAEFKEWFRKKGVKGEVSLLTGDIKIRAPPGTKNELIICTSEILRNKLVKASGVAQGADPAQMVPDGGGQLQVKSRVKLSVKTAVKIDTYFARLLCRGQTPTSSAWVASSQTKCTTSTILSAGRSGRRR